MNDFIQQSIEQYNKEQLEYPTKLRKAEAARILTQKKKVIAAFKKLKIHLTLKEVADSLEQDIEKHGLIFHYGFSNGQGSYGGYRGGEIVNLVYRCSSCGKDSWYAVFTFSDIGKLLSDKDYQCKFCTKSPQTQVDTWWDRVWKKP